MQGKQYLNEEQDEIFNETSNSNKIESQKLLNKKSEYPKLLSGKDLFYLTLALAGVQFTWSVELAYGTPYLLSLGLPKSLTVLVWLAGPLSGLIIQPLIGFYSDRCTSKYGRRRPFIIFGTLLVILSILCISYSKEMGKFLSFGDNENIITIWIAVIAFYGLDFAINIVQACCRALSIDVSPGSQQNAASIWASRMIGIGNIMGYFMGFIDLRSYFPFLGSTQLKILCFIANITLIICVALTCVKTHEMVYVDSNKDNNLKWYTPLVNIVRSMSNLPSPIQKICNVQFWSWIGWFPFLFFTTAWINYVYYLENSDTPKDEVNDNNATRIGSLALLIYSIVSLIASFILPIIKSSQSNRPSNIADPQAFYKKVWIFSELFLASVFFLTIFVGKIWHAIAIISLCGISWAVSMWVPFALIGEFLEGYSNPNETSSSTLVDDRENEQSSSGTILGIHNMYVVLPQFVVTFLSSAFFALIKILEIQEESFDGFGWVLRFGGIGALISTLLIPKISFKVKRIN